MGKRVYLAGPITGLDYRGSTDWRKHAVEKLANEKIIGVSPMRAKDYLRNEAKINDEYDTPLSRQKGLTVRDRFEVHRCDIMLANLLGAEKVSIGTIIE